jgi:membrane protein required for colicin V production
LLDILAVAILGFGFYRGFTRGFVLSIFSLVAWFIGLVAALKLTDVGTGYMRDWTDSKSPWVPIVTFIVIFLAVVVIVILFAKLIDQIITVAQLGLWNKLAGGVLETLIFVLVLSVTVWMFNNGGFISPEAKSESKLYGIVSPVAPGFFTWLGHNVPAFSDLLDNLKPYFGQFHLPKLQDVLKQP